MILSSVVFLVLAGTALGFLSDDPAWDALRVRFGRTFDSSDYFVHMPRTTTDAVAQGFKKASDCDDKAVWRGARYVKDDDYVLILLFDKNGYIAGIQTQIPSGLSNGYPKSNIQPPFIKDGDNFVLTAYFVSPDTICSTGRNQTDFERGGTGYNLYLQKGANPDTDSVAMPIDEADIASTKWTEGKCFPTMGKHYWYNLSKNMSCDDFFPVFLMYNGKKLNSFGWAIGAHLDSKMVEYPPTRALGLFFKEVPTCLTKVANNFSTLHIYLTEDIASNLC